MIPYKVIHAFECVGCKCKLILSGYVELRKGSPRNAIIEKTSLELKLYEHDLEGGSLEPWLCYQDSLKKRKELGWTNHHSKTDGHNRLYQKFQKLISIPVPKQTVLSGFQI